jgi:DNA-binding transcriptional regulator PaaX
MAKSLPGSTLEYILWALVPYSEPNLKLAFKPNLFFNDLERISRRKQQTLRNTYYKALNHGLVEIDSDKTPRLTTKGNFQLKRFRPQKLKNAELMVIFDIPESQRHLRRRLRAILNEFKFKLVQKSVWVSRYDCQEYLKLELKQYNLEPHVFLYEASRL